MLTAKELWEKNRKDAEQRRINEHIGGPLPRDVQTLNTDRKEQTDEQHPTTLGTNDSERRNLTG